MQDPPAADKSNGAPGRTGGVILGRVSAPGPAPHPLDASLQRLRRSALIAIGVCALGIAGLSLAAPAGGQDTPVDRRYTWTALALAAGSILTRRSVSGARSPRAFVGLQLASILLAFGLALLGGLLATRGGQWQVGLLYNVAAALLLARPLARLAPPRREGP
jgi:hypothetical protein